MVISSKITEIEHANITPNANITSLIFLQKQQIDSLEIECNKLGFQYLSQCEESLSITSNNHGTENSLQAWLQEDQPIH